MSTELKVLIGRLNPITKRALETAAALCVAQTNYNVEVEHFLLKLLDLPATDVAPVFRYYKVDPAELSRQLTTAIEKFARGNSRTPAMSPQIVRMLREGWVQSTLFLESGTIRSGGILMGLYDDEALRTTIYESCPVLAKVSLESLRETLRELITESSETGLTAPAATAGSPAQSSPAQAAPIDTTALGKYTV